MTVEGASAALLADLLVDFEAELRKQNAHIDELLRPPASPALVEETFAKIGLKAPAEVVALYGWHDGCVATGEGEAALPARFLLSLEAVPIRYNLSRLGLGEWDWNPSWAQVMGGKYGIAVSCADDPDQLPLVRSVENSAGTADWQTDYQVVSLCTPVTWWIDCMRRGWYKYDQSTRSWNRPIGEIPQKIRMYGMS